VQPAVTQLEDPVGDCRGLGLGDGRLHEAP